MERVMAKWWLGVALTVGGLVVARPAAAQYSQPDPGPSGFTPAGYLPAAPGTAAALPPPGPPGSDCLPGPVPLGGPSVGGPDNAFPEPDCCPKCCARECFHFNVDYLGWFLRKNNLPPLVTQGRFSQPDPAALGQIGTVVLLDHNSLDDTFRNGIRIGAGVDLDPAGVWSVEGSAFVLENRVFHDAFAGSSVPRSPVLGRPLINGLNNAEAASLISFPGVLAGNLNVALGGRLYGGDANVHYNLWPGAGYGGRFDFLAGARYLGLDEGLSFDQSVQEASGAGHFDSSESLRTNNRFYGGQVGLSYSGNVGAVFMNAVGKFAVGQNHQILNNAALATTIDASGNIATTPNQGVLVEPSNAGRFSHWHTAYVPEFGMNLGYQFNRNLSLAAGYTLIVWTNVLRPEGAIDRTINPSPVDGTAPRPEPTFHTTTFWAQGVNASLILSF
jgi:hypothetical protein